MRIAVHAPHSISSHLVIAGHLDGCERGGSAQRWCGTAPKSQHTFLPHSCPARAMNFRQKRNGGPNKLPSSSRKAMHHAAVSLCAVFHAVHLQPDLLDR